MAQLASDILKSIEAGRYIVGTHAADQLQERLIPMWQAVGATLDGTLLYEYPQADPNPVVEFEVLLADGVSAKAVWSWLEADREALFVTIHFFDR